MSLPQETMLQLMAFADGELEGDDQARIEALVAQSSEARQVVEAIRSPVLGSWLSEEMNARAVGADGIADAVMADLAKAEPASGGGAEVVRLAERGGRRGARVQVVGGALIAALALAAGVALYVSSVGLGADATKAPVASVGVPSVDVEPPSPATAVAQRPSQGVEVDEVDSPARGFSVFEIPVGGSPAGAANAAGPSSVVIMIDDPPGAK
jgi:hypothetical protein